MNFLKRFYVIGPWHKRTAMLLDPRFPSGSLRVILGSCKNAKSSFTREKLCLLKLFHSFDLQKGGF